MMRISALSRAVPVAVLSCLASRVAVAQPAVGSMAPDFTIATVTAFNATPKAVTLSSLRGKTVVLAFFPKARTSGCTAQMKAYRDQYTALFGGGDSVLVLGISTDNPRTLASWAQELKTPVTFGADTTDAIGKLYAAKMPVLPIHKRHLIVVDPAGRIAWDARPFRELAQPSYDSLAAAVRRARATH
jgi:thioredoxin-dependent peroxiredoxin